MPTSSAKPIIIEYSPLPDIKSKIVLAPLIPVTFINGEYEFSTFALVDSGASGAVISTVIAEALNIDWIKLPSEMGYSVGSNFKFRRFDKLQAEIYDHKFHFSINIIEGVSPYKCILGQADIFQRAKITFEGYKKKFEIRFREYN